MSEQILQWIVEQTTALRLPGPWGFVNPVKGMRVLSGTAQELVTSLVNKFSADELVSNRILSCDGDDNYQLSPVIRGPFKVLRPQADAAPIDFENEHGRLSPGDPPAFRFSDDYMTREKAAERKWVLATFSDNDVALLKMLRLPATPACGLATMTEKQAAQFLAPADKTASAPQPAERPKIILAATELFALRNQMPPGSLKAAKQFAIIERAMKLDTSNAAGIWLPSTADFQQILDGVALASAQLVRSAIVKSVACSESVKAYFNRTTAPVLNEVIRERRKLFDGLKALKNSSFGNRDLEPRLAAYRQAYGREFIGPVYREATKAADPCEKSLWNALGELTELQLEASYEVRLTRAAIATGRPEIDDVSLDERLRFQLRLADGVIRLNKALGRER